MEPCTRRPLRADLRHHPAPAPGAVAPQAMEPLLQSEHAAKVHLFALGKEGRANVWGDDQIYLHAKTLLVDDDFALVGSTGVEKAVSPCAERGCTPRD